MVLLSAPAGYGKTTLIAEWIHTHRTGSPACAWLSLDSADNDAERFFTHFLAAFQQTGALVSDTVQRFAALPKLPAADMLLDALINALVGVETPVLLVMDDYHVITNPVIHEGMEYFLNHQPAVVQLVIATREDPPLSLPRLRARQQLTEIRARDLRFTTEEARQFFAQAMRLDLAEETARALGERAEGWAVGLQLAGLALQNVPDPERFVQLFRGNHRYVLDYLAEEVLARQEERIRQFLSQTSVLERFNADLCCALTGEAEAQTVIEYLEKANLFIIPLDDERVWYRYHHLFSDYLTTLLTQTERARLNKKAAAWHEAHEMFADAVRYAVSSGDPDFSAGVVERAVSRNMTWSGGNVALLTSWLNALPAHTLQARPELNLNASRIFYLASQFDLAEKHLAQAEEALRTPPPGSDVGHLLALAALYRGSIASARGDIQQALEHTRYALERLPVENHLAHARAYFNLGQVDEMADQMGRAVENYMRSSDAAQLAGVSFLAIQARCAAAQVQVQQGELEQAEQSCQAAIRCVDGARIPPVGLAFIVLGSIALERCAFSAAREFLQDGIALSRQGGLIDNVVLGLACLARLCVYQGDAAGALLVVQEAREVIQTFDNRYMSSYTLAFLARIQLAAGKIQDAARWAAGYQAKRNISTTEYEEITLARFLLAGSQHAAVPALLLPILEKATNAGRYYACIEITLLLSMCYHAKAEPDLAIEWLTRSLKIAAPRGFACIFFAEGEALLNLLIKARAAAPHFVDRLVEGIKPDVEGGVLANDRLPERLSEQELRVLGLIVAGKSNQEIAAALVISVGTAKWHVHNILQKLGVSNRSQAIARAQELGLR